MCRRQKTTEEQEGDTDVETALAAPNEDNDTNLEETDVQEVLLAYKESGQLRGEQRMNRGDRPARANQWRKDLPS